jgi:hypothetical protein
MSDREQHEPRDTSGMRFRRFWAAYVEALKRYLDRMDQLLPTKAETGRKRRGLDRKWNKGESK